MNEVLFYPDPPIQLPGHTLSKTIKYFQLCGYKPTNDITSDWFIGVHWDIRDVNTIPDIFIDDNRLVLNVKLTDVTKSNVDKVFTRVFGYSSMADTDAFGYCVRKGENQSAHDGEIIKTPCKREPGYIYQILIDNRSSLQMVCDIRVPIFLGEIPEIFMKHKSIEGTFEFANSKHRDYYLILPDEVLSASEQDKIKLFCKEIGLDLGEVDVLRDNSTGLIYIIDVNNIPGGGIFDHIKDGAKVEKRFADYLKDLLPEPIKINNGGYTGNFSI